MPPVPTQLAVKGFAGSADRADLAGQGIHAGALTYPFLAVDRDALESNIAAMGRFCADAGVALAPHAKTTMAPAIFRRQLAAGAWGLTAASITHARVYAGHGVRRILLANELVDPAAISATVALLVGGIDLICYVDSVAGVRLLDAALPSLQAGSAPPLGVLLELGHAGGRTGVRDDPTAYAVADAVRRSETLRLVGVAGYEGGIGTGRDRETLTAVAEFCDRIARTGRELVAAGHLEPNHIRTAGGSAYPDVVAEHLAGDGATVVLRSGSYVVHDHGMYAHGSPFSAAGSPYRLRAALTVWTQVLSRPEPESALLSAGRRDVSFDAGMPVPLAARYDDGSTAPATAATVTRLNDQHAFLRCESDFPLDPGDRVALGISHPCTTMDKWTHAVEVDADERIVDVIRTYF